MARLEGRADLDLTVRDSAGARGALRSACEARGEVEAGELIVLKARQSGNETEVGLLGVSVCSGLTVER